MKRILKTVEPFFGEIVAGRKTVEIRLGEEYRNIQPGETLVFRSPNGGEVEREVLAALVAEHVVNFLYWEIPSVAADRIYADAGFESHGSLCETLADFYPQYDWGCPGLAKIPGAIIWLKPEKGADE